VLERWAEQCLLCGAEALAPVPGYEQFQRVTSDCKPWPAGGQLVVCQTCCGVQNLTSDRWHAEAARIYGDYTIYYQSNGVEQLVCDPDSGQLAERSARVLERFQALERLPRDGRLLDVGCGNGALLRAFARLQPGWTIAGSDLSDRFRDTIESIPGVERLYTCPPVDIPGTFDVIALMHALEHVPSPLNLLAELRGKLGPNGVLLVQVPNADRNAFDLMVADHCSHFSPTTLPRLISRAGFDVTTVAVDWVSKEVSLVGRPRRSIPASTTDLVGDDCGQVLNATRNRLGWLRTVVEDARAVARHRPFGVFGTSIAAVWLYGELQDVTDFFVDEDPNRAGGLYMGLPIYHPRDVPRGSHVYLGVAPELAERIRARLIDDPSLDFALYAPPGVTV